MDTVIKTTYKQMQNGEVDMDFTDDYFDCFDDCHIIENKNFGKDIIIAEGPVTVLQDLGISFVEGTYCAYNNETDECEPDFGITVIYTGADLKSLDFDDFTYFEQDDPLTTIHNYLHLIGATEKQVCAIAA